MLNTNSSVFDSGQCAAQTDKIILSRQFDFFLVSLSLIDVNISLFRLSCDRSIRTKQTNEQRTNIHRIVSWPLNPSPPAAVRRIATDVGSGNAPSNDPSPIVVDLMVRPNIDNCHSRVVFCIEQHDRTFNNECLLSVSSTSHICDGRNRRCAFRRATTRCSAAARRAPVRVAIRDHLDCRVRSLVM